MAIYAIDFDNTLAITRFPEIIAPNKKMVAFAKTVNIMDKQSRGRPGKCRGVVQIARTCI